MDSTPQSELITLHSWICICNLVNRHVACVGLSNCNRSTWTFSMCQVFRTWWPTLCRVHLLSPQNCLTLGTPTLAPNLPCGCLPLHHIRASRNVFRLLSWLYALVVLFWLFAVPRALHCTWMLARSQSSIASRTFAHHVCTCLSMHLQL